MSKTALWSIIISSVFVGLIADFITIADGYPEGMAIGFGAGYIFFLPISLFIFIKIIGNKYLKDKVLIVSSSMLLFMVVMALPFILLEYRHGPGQISDMYGLVYLLGAVPALVLGLIYGLVIYSSLDK